MTDVYKRQGFRRALTRTLKKYAEDNKMLEKAKVETVSYTHLDVYKRQFLNIVARASLKKNLDHSFEQAKVEIADDLLVAPTALAKAVLPYCFPQLMRESYLNFA